MIIGHYGLALAAKRLAPRTSLGVLFLASQFLDLLAHVFVPLGIETMVFDRASIHLVMPVAFTRAAFSHSLLAACLWAVLFGGVYFKVTRNGRGALVAAALVVSHWFLDIIVHGHGLPIYPGGPLVGFGLWRSMQLTVAVELWVLFGGGAWIYARATRPLDRAGRNGFAALLAFAAMLYAFALYKPPEPSLQSAGFFGLWDGLIFAAFWLERHRTGSSREAARP